MKVQTDSLRANSAALKKVSTKLAQCAEEVSRADWLLADETIGQRFHQVLSSEYRTVLELRAQLQSFQMTLDRIADQYDRSEERIADHAEGDDVTIGITVTTRVIPLVPGPSPNPRIPIRLWPVGAGSGEDFVGW